MRVSPSLLAVDFLNLEYNLKILNDSECDYVHLDVMDGNFVKDITFGLPLIKNIKKVCEKELDVHLMVIDPTYMVLELIKLNVAIITVHAEVLKNIDFGHLLNKCKNNGIKLGIALNPDSDVETYKEVIKNVDYVLLMSVYPGKGGQSFIKEVLLKVEEIKNINSNVTISIDGGINNKNIGLVKESGLDVAVSGTYIFEGDVNKNIASLR